MKHIYQSKVDRCAFLVGNTAKIVGFDSKLSM